MLNYIENAAAFLCGLFLSAGLTWLLKHKFKYVFIVIINSLIGGAAYLIWLALIQKTAPAVINSFIIGGAGVIGLIGVLGVLWGKLF